MAASISSITNMPYLFTLNGTRYNVEVEDDVRKMPLVFQSFLYAGEEWYFNNYFRFCATLHENAGNTSLATVLREKADALEDDPQHGEEMISRAKYMMPDKRTWTSVCLLPHLNNEVKRPIDRRSYIVNFRNNTLTGLTPRQTKYDFDLHDFTYFGTRISVDGKEFDLLNINDVRRIDTSNKVFDFSSIGSATTNLGYILRFQAANIEMDGFPEIAIEILKKSFELYEHSLLYGHFLWKKSDFSRLPKTLRKYNRIEEAVAYEQRIDELFLHRIP